MKATTKVWFSLAVLMIVGTAVLYSITLSPPIAVDNTTVAVNNTPQARLIEPPVTVTEITITPEPEIVTVYEPVQLKHLQSHAELKQFITWTWASSPAYLELKERLDYNTPEKCELWAMGCQQFAQSQGYLINFQVTGFHAECSAVIGNEIWMVDPKSGDIRLWGFLD